MTWLNFLLFRLSVGVEGGLNLILFNLWVFALWPVVHRDNSVRKTTWCIFMGPFFCHLSMGWLLTLKSKEQEIFKWLELLCTLHDSEQYCNTNIPLLGSWVHRVPQSIIWVVLKGHPGCWVPLGVFLPKTFLSVCAEPQFLTFTKLHNQNVCIVESTKMFKNWDSSWREEDLKTKPSAQPWNKLYTHHPAQHNHWGHCPDSWTSPEMPRKMTYCFQSSLLIQ